MEQRGFVTAVFDCGSGHRGKERVEEEPADCARGPWPSRIDPRELGQQRRRGVRVQRPNLHRAVDHRKRRLEERAEHVDVDARVCVERSCLLHQRAPDLQVVHADALEREQQAFIPAKRVPEEHTVGKRDLRKARDEALDEIHGADQLTTSRQRFLREPIEHEGRRRGHRQVEFAPLVGWPTQGR